MGEIATEFQDLVNMCYKTRSPRLISNMSFAHAHVLIEKLFRLARDRKQDVRIITGSLNDEFYSEHASDVTNFLSDGAGKLEVIVVDPRWNATNNRFAKAAVDGKGTLLKVRQRTSMVGVPHFLLVGKEAFRVERDPEQVQAVASFFSPDFAAFLHNIFTELRTQTVTAATT